MAKIEAVLEHRRMLVDVRTLALHHVQDQISKLPTEIRDQLSADRQDRVPASSPRRSRHRRHGVDDGRRLPVVVADRVHRPGPPSPPRDPPTRTRSRRARSMSTAPHCATNPASDRSRQQHSSSKSATRTGSRASPSSLAGAAPAQSPCRPAKATVSPSGIASTSAATGGSTACSTSPASPNNATSTRPATTSTAKSAKARPAAKLAEPTNDTSPTESSDACGTTNHDDRTSPFTSPLDKGASDSPWYWLPLRHGLRESHSPDLDRRWLRRQPGQSGHVVGSVQAECSGASARGWMVAACPAGNDNSTSFKVCVQRVQSAGGRPGVRVLRPLRT